jgi:CBS domain-containing protein
MSAGRICVREVDLVEPGESVHAAAQRMHARNVGTLVLLDSEKRPLGMLTDRDLTTRVLAKGYDAAQTTVGDIVTKCLQTVSENTPIEDALRVMRAGNCRRLPVVDHDGKLVGILSVDDILEVLISEFRDLGALLREESPRSLAGG